MKKWLLIVGIGLGVAYHFFPKETVHGIKTTADKSARATVAAAKAVATEVQK